MLFISFVLLIFGISFNTQDSRKKYMGEQSFLVTSIVTTTKRCKYGGDIITYLVYTDKNNTVFICDNYDDFVLFKKGMYYTCNMSTHNDYGIYDNYYGNLHIDNIVSMATSLDFFKHNVFEKFKSGV